MAAGTNRSLALPVLLLFFYAVVATSSSSSILSEKVGGDDENCVYTIYVQTGYLLQSGTDSNISLSLAGSDGVGIEIENLVSWGGLMGLGHDYFEWGNLDIFSGRGRCLSSPLCLLNITSDGTGLLPAWYCKYVEVTVTGSNQGCSQHDFKVEQWLSTDRPPKQLYATRDVCLLEKDGFTGTRFLPETGPGELGTVERG
ncbi:hypothetical protein HPP92_003849 [Vanilla planifolia]|uniref:PLAT domain-containing protein n=1 Tax=Vanilla planifolia TaxID=51239 RepID=A0A835SH80_VANPL|nr:hypothetical protein HPP92_003849 [Vanilla planifolia]